MAETIHAICSQTRLSAAVTYRMRLYAARGALLALICLTWALLARRLGPDTLPDPFQVFERIWEITLSGDMVHNSFVTLGEVAGGILVGGGLGILLPFLLSLSPRATRAVEPIIRIAMGIPKLALSPIIILWFGIGLTSKIVLIALMVFFMIFVSTFAGIRSADHRLVLMCRIVGSRPAYLLREVSLNSALPFVLASLKTAFPWAVNAAIVAEFLAADAGLGHYIRHSYDSADTVGAFAGVVVVTALMVIIDIVFVGIQSRLLRWRPVDTEAVH